MNNAQASKDDGQASKDGVLAEARRSGRTHRPPKLFKDEIADESDAGPRRSANSNASGTSADAEHDVQSARHCVRRVSFRCLHPTLSQPCCVKMPPPNSNWCCLMDLVRIIGGVIRFRAAH